MNEADDDRTIVRRKFTLPEKLDMKLERLARHNYQGNVSRCLRASIHDHEESLNEDGQVAIERIQHQIAELNETVETVVNQLIEAQEKSSGPNQRSVVFEQPVSALSDDARHVIELFNDGMALRVADVIERSEFPARRTMDLIERLVDVRQLVWTESGERLQLATTSVSGSRSI